MKTRGSSRQLSVITILVLPLTSNSVTAFHVDETTLPGAQEITLHFEHRGHSEKGSSHFSSAQVIVSSCIPKMGLHY